MPVWFPIDVTHSRLTDSELLKRLGISVQKNLVLFNPTLESNPGLEPLDQRGIRWYQLAGE